MTIRPRPVACWHSPLAVLEHGHALLTTQHPRSGRIDGIGIQLGYGCKDVTIMRDAFEQGTLVGLAGLTSCLGTVGCEDSAGAEFFCSKPCTSSIVSGGIPLTPREVDGAIPDASQDLVRLPLSTKVRPL